jgi:hypothetical protein
VQLHLTEIGTGSSLNHEQSCVKRSAAPTTYSGTVFKVLVLD